MNRRPRSAALVLAATSLLVSARGGTAEESSGTRGDDSQAEASTPTPSSSPAQPSPSPTSESAPPVEPAGQTLDVQIAGDQVSPNAQEISLDVGEPLELVIASDRAGELHVHSKPEQYVQFQAGESSQPLVVETPGQVEVEDHDTGVVVAVLEVS